MSKLISYTKSLVLRFIDFIYPSALFKVDDHKVVVTSFRGKNFSGNPALVVRALLKKNRSLDIVWLALDVDAAVPAGVRVVKYNSIASYYELATAKIWIDDFRKKYFPRKKINQRYYQVWHGVLPLKKIELDAEDKLDKVYLREAKRDGRHTDYMLAGNTYTANVYKHSFWFSGKVLDYGTPSLDGVLESKSESVSSRVKESLDLVGKRTVLYCPTFRDEFTLSDYHIDSGAVCEALGQRFGGEWKVLIRLHPNAREHEAQVVADNPNSVGVTAYPNLQELITMADFVVTDFSSVMFNALYAETPTFIFAKDYERYIHDERGVYDIITHLPFSISRGTDELIQNIEHFDIQEFLAKREAFLHFIGNSETGHSAELLATHVLEEMAGGTR
ncbi:CDP-glycerol glycerophosphotransferase family protein [Lacticaseibacillus sp. GG6-2]